MCDGIDNQSFTCPRRTVEEEGLDVVGESFSDNFTSKREDDVLCHKLANQGH